MEPKISIKEGVFKFFSIIFSSPLPKLTMINNCGVMPIIEPKKKFFILTLNNVGKIFDINNELVPIGVPGEICVGGDGLARGYLNQEELSKDNFIINPYISDEMIYKTGDIGKRLINGDIEFIGRKDNQVKIQGHRIELGEVEHTILKNKSVTEAVVISIDNEENEKEMIAYFTAEIAIAETEIRDFFRKYHQQKYRYFLLPIWWKDFLQ